MVSNVVGARGGALDPVQRMRNIWVDAQMSAPPIGTKAVTGFEAVANASTGGVDISFRITDTTGMASISLLRAKVNDVAQAVVLQSWTASQSAFTWSDTDKLLQQMGQAYYWLKLQPANPTAASVTVGPQFILLNPSLLPPLALAGISASHAAAVNGTVLVTCNVTLLGAGDAVKIYVSGYHGSAANVAVAERAAEALQFTLEATGEAVTLTAIAVSSGGAEAASGPTCGLTLNGTATAPAAIEALEVAQIATGNQVEWPSSLEAGVTGYELFRGNRGGGFGAASLLATVAATSAGTVIYLDTGGLTGDFEYFVVAQSGAGNSAPSPAANPQVLYSSALVPGNASANTSNNATLDSVDAGTSATVRIYGPGGVGTGYTRNAGYGTPARPGGSITGLGYSTKYYVIFEAATQSYAASVNYTDTLPDGYEWVGVLTTVASGGAGGGSSGGTGAAAQIYGTAYGSSFAPGNVEITSPGYGYGSAQASCSAFSGQEFEVICENGEVTSISAVGPVSFASSAGPFPMTITSTSPYTGGGGSAAGNGGSRYVLSS